ncbi:MAG: nuclear transport factor 2 family protein [Solirubrobacterales bacterium]
MSEENVDLARRYVETFNSNGLDAAESLWHPDVELVDPPQLPDADRHSGRPAMRQQVEGYVNLGWDGQFRSPEYFAADDEVVVVWHGKGRSPQGVEIEHTMAQVFLFEDGQVRRVKQFLTKAEALEAAGLSE